MATGNRDLLEVLEAELNFAEKGGYRCTARVPWRPQFIFQDSPTCLNFDSTAPRRPCSECILMQLVPPERRQQKIPCRHIALNAQGETIDDFYRCGTPEELEKALISWLKATLGTTEAERVRKKLAKTA
jgi:hypothetical protein